VSTQPPTSADALPGRARLRAWRHAAIVAGAYTVVFGWMYLRPALDGTFLAESDLYEYYLPIFLAPITRWSHFEFGGLPAFADPGDFTAYPPHFLFARLVGSWTALSVSAFVMGACFTYAYVYRLTRSVSGAAFAGLAYGVSEAMMERLPHPGTLHAFAWLPLLLLALESVGGHTWRRWVAIGALAAACCFLAGHPQPAIYVYYCAALYALVGGWAERRGRAYFLRVAGLFVLGGLLTFIKALPFVEASFYMARQETSFAQFASHANSPAQMWSVIFPTILHEGREAPTYVGLITLALAIVGLGRAWRSSWRVPFWAAVAVIALLIGVGDSTPLAGLAYRIPLYSNFRAGARHLFLAAFALSVFAGFGIDAIRRGAASRRLGGLAAGALAAAVAIGAAVLASAPGWFGFEGRTPLPVTLPVWSDGVWVQFVIALATVAVMMAASRAGRTTRWFVAACALLLADTLYSLPYRVTPTGLVPITIPASATTPSVHATRLAAAVEPERQRLLAPGGTHRDAVVPAAWARLWQIPIAGGYGPMLLAWHNDLAQMGTNGSVRPIVFAPDDVGLDLLAVGRVVMRAEDLARPATFERDGITWSEPPLGIAIGRAECGPPYARTLALPLPADVDITEIAIVGQLRCLENLESGAEVLRVALHDDTGAAYEQPLRAGVDLAERELSSPSVAARAMHGPARVFADPALSRFAYLTTIRPPAPVRATRLVLEVPPLTGWVEIERVTLVDARGRAFPRSLDDFYLGDRGRWVETERFETARTTDRARDERAREDTGFVVFENRRALPRAWMVSRVVPVDETALLDAVRHSQLPDGQRFDPREMALVDAAEHAEPRQFAPADWSARVDSIRDSYIAVDVSSQGGYLVLSEAFYPGWRARIGNVPLDVERADHGLQGVVVPAGTHRVEFEFDPLTLRIGKVVSGAALVVLLALLGVPVRPRGDRAPFP
jgi:hypothetical protein